MKDFAAIDFETANNEPTSVCSAGIVIGRDGVMDYPDYKFYCTLQKSRRVRPWGHHNLDYPKCEGRERTWRMANYKGTSIIQNEEV